MARGIHGHKGDYEPARRCEPYRAVREVRARGRADGVPVAARRGVIGVLRCPQRTHLQQGHPGGDGVDSRQARRASRLHGRGHGGRWRLRAQPPPQDEGALRQAARHAPVRVCDSPLCHWCRAGRVASDGRDSVRGLRCTGDERVGQQRGPAALAMGSRGSHHSAHPIGCEDAQWTVSRQHDRIVVQQRPGAGDCVPKHPSGRLRPANRVARTGRSGNLPRAHWAVRPQGRSDGLGGVNQPGGRQGLGARAIGCRRDVDWQGSRVERRKRPDHSDLGGHGACGNGSGL